MSTWLTACIATREDRQFRKGFEWAMGEIFLNNTSLIEVESESMKYSHTYSTGVLHAVYKVRALRKALATAEAILPKES